MAFVKRKVEIFFTNKLHTLTILHEHIDMPDLSAKATRFYAFLPDIGAEISPNLTIFQCQLARDERNCVIFSFAEDP